MEPVDYTKLEMLACEAFIRRAAELNFSFMLKGSYVTRHYFPNPKDRIPADLDWVFLEKLYDQSTARQKFTEWVTLITELDLGDGVKFQSFKKNEFWRRIDYAMAEDFPTANTDLKCWVGKEELIFPLDISFNLDIEQPPVPLLYEPLEGEPFLIANTAPLSLQVSWKIHQTLVRPRFKDLFDLKYLVKHSDFDKKTLDFSLQALINECYVDNVELNKLKQFLNYDIAALFPHDSIEREWKFWRGMTEDSSLPMELSEFLEEFKTILEKAGFTILLWENLPETTKQKKRIVETPIVQKPTDEQQVQQDSSKNKTDASSGFLGFLKNIF